MAFNKNGELLVPFRTWRNTNTEKAAKKLTKEFQYNIPLRWSISHLYEAVLDKEEHVNDITYITTLAGYIHWKLTGRKVLGVGDASGMFPIDSKTRQYDQTLMEKFNQLMETENVSWSLKDILPEVLVAGEQAGNLTEEGAKLLDVTGNLESGIALCPPEGDAGTGMVATNSVAVRTGNVSAGTSVFAMVVLEEELKQLHEEIDLVTTPSGDLVAMVHCNNCTSDINAWANIFKEFAQCMGFPADTNALYTGLFKKALEGDPDCGGLMGFNYFSGEPITGFEEGRPIVIRTPETKFNLANFMRMNLYTSLGALKVGLDILLKEEQVKIDKMLGHGGFFKTPVVGQKVMSAAMNAPVSVMETAGEGGAWGIAVLAAYMQGKEKEEALDAYLNQKVFAGQEGTTIMADKEDVAGFDVFMVNYKNCLPVEEAAVKAI
jgi:sugar (pentulose or hexulose) kinase